MLAHPPLLAISDRSPRKTTVANNNLNIANITKKNGYVCLWVDIENEKFY